MLLFLLFACIQQAKNETTDTEECELSVVQYASGLSDKQTEVAETIESQLGEMEIPDNIIAAAIVNAVAESGLNPNAIEVTAIAITNKWGPRTSTSPPP